MMGRRRGPKPRWSGHKCQSLCSGFHQEILHPSLPWSSPLMFRELRPCLQDGIVNVRAEDLPVRTVPTEAHDALHYAAGGAPLAGLEVENPGAAASAGLPGRPSPGERKPSRNPWRIDRRRRRRLNPHYRILPCFFSNRHCLLWLKSDRPGFLQRREAHG